jgi:glycosyltransferase involved in cell wall biosynthesis
MTTKKIYVVIPVFNEADVINHVIDEVRNSGEYQMIVVDDGSCDKTFELASNNNDVIVLRHKINRGKGAAVKTGVVAATSLGASVVVTIDGDGQHDPQDINVLADLILNDGYDVVLGTRVIDKGEMPFVKKFANHIGNMVTWLFYGILVSDSQSGFRAYSHFAATIIDTKADKYEYDSKIIREIKNHRLTFVEAPIHVRYTEHSMTKPQKQGLVNGIKTVVRMIWDKLI